MMENPTLMYIGIAIGGVAIGFLVRLFIDSQKVMKSKNQASQIIRKAQKEVSNIKRDAVIDAKEAVMKVRSEFDKEKKESQKEMQSAEKRVQQRQSTLDKKFDQIDQKERETENRSKDLKRQLEKAEQAEKQYEEAVSMQVDKLESIAAMSRDQAKEQIKSQLFEKTRTESALAMKKIEDEALAEANKKANKIISLAIQRCAADSVAESTVSVVQLDGDEMKGRIIGREGRNIKAIETLTGVDLIIDDTPEAVILSCFDPVKREIARMTLERLIQDGRIHPARVEDLVNKSTKEMDKIIQDAGEKAVLEVGCDVVHPEIVRLLGRLKFRTSYSQNVLRHSVEVGFLCGMMASELGLDSKVARRAGLLHDIGKALTHEIDGPHAAIGGTFARKHGEMQEIINSIESHHEDVEAETVIATLVAAADALSASRPGARCEMLEAYVKRLNQLEEITNSFKGVDNTYAIQAGREVRVSVVPERVNDSQAYILAKDIANKIETEMSYPGEIKVTVIRETRVTEVAR